METQNTIITSRDNAKIKYACKLKNSSAFRADEKSFMAEGLKLCLELGESGVVKTLFVTQKILDKNPELLNIKTECFIIENHVAEKLSDTKTAQGVFAICAIPCYTIEVLKKSGRYLLLENVQDPGNVGTLLRSAVAFGFDAVLLSDGCAGVFSPKTLRASMGTAVKIPVVEQIDVQAVISALQKLQVPCLAAALYNSEPLGSIRLPNENGVCIAIGSEGQGLKLETCKACDKAVRIPMTPNIESLNAGIAGSLLLWEFRMEGL